MRYVGIGKLITALLVTVCMAIGCSRAPDQSVDPDGSIASMPVVSEDKVSDNSILEENREAQEPVPVQDKAVLDPVNQETDESTQEAQQAIPYPEEGSPFTGDPVDREILLVYGAQEISLGENEAGLQTTLSSMFTIPQYGWEWSELTEISTSTYYWWYNGYLRYQGLTSADINDEYGHPDGGFLFPQKDVEAAVTRHFDVTVEYLRDSSKEEWACYEPENQAYRAKGAPDGVFQWHIIYQRTEVDGEYRHLYLSIYSPQTDFLFDYVLTVQMEDEGQWKYVSYKRQ